MFAPKTLLLAWLKVRANKGARYLPAFGGTGVDGQSALPEAGQPNQRFAARAELYLSELSAALRDGSYRPQAVKRVDIPSMRRMAAP